MRKPKSLVKQMPRPITPRMHGALDYATSAMVVAAPWLLRFSRHRAARNLCFGLAALTVVVATLTDWNGDGTDGS